MRYAKWVLSLALLVCYVLLDIGTSYASRAPVMGEIISIGWGGRTAAATQVATTAPYWGLVHPDGDTIRFRIRLPDGSIFHEATSSINDPGDSLENSLVWFTIPIPPGVGWWGEWTVLGGSFQIRERGGFGWGPAPYLFNNHSANILATTHILPDTQGTFAVPLEGHVYAYPTQGVTTAVFTGTIGGVHPNLRLRITDVHAGIAPVFDITNIQGPLWERSINILGVGPFRADLLDAAGTVLASRNFSISAVPPPPPPTQPVPPPPPVDPVAPPTLGVDPTIWDRIFWAVDYVIWLIGRPFRLLAELLAVLVDNVQALVGEQFGVLGAVMGAFYSALPPEASVLLSTLLMVFTVVTIYRLVRP